MLTAIMDGKFKTKSTCSFIFTDKYRLTLSLVAFAWLCTKIWLDGSPKYSTFVQLASALSLVYGYIHLLTSIFSIRVSACVPHISHLLISTFNYDIR